MKETGNLSNHLLQNSPKAVLSLSHRTAHDTGVKFVCLSAADNRPIESKHRGVGVRAVEGGVLLFIAWPTTRSNSTLYQEAAQISVREVPPQTCSPSPLFLQRFPSVPENGKAIENCCTSNSSTLTHTQSMNGECRNNI